MRISIEVRLVDALQQDRSDGSDGDQQITGGLGDGVAEPVLNADAIALGDAEVSDLIAAATELELIGAC